MTIVCYLREIAKPFLFLFSASEKYRNLHRLAIISEFKNVFAASLTYIKTNSIAKVQGVFCRKDSDCFDMGLPLEISVQLLENLNLLALQYFLHNIRHTELVMCFCILYVSLEFPKYTN